MWLWAAEKTLEISLRTVLASPAQDATFPSRTLYESSASHPPRTADASRNLGNALRILEKGIHLRDFQRIADAFVRPGESHRVSLLLMTHIGSDQGADARRINIRNLGEIEHQTGRTVAANQVLKLVERADSKRAGKPESPFLVLLAEVFYGKGFVAHGLTF